MRPRAARAGHRNVAVDALRAAALIGIMMNHIFGAEMASLVWWDTHAIGFALLIGAGAAFAVPASGGSRAKPVARAWLRASVLVAAGFFLESVPNGGVAVILVRLAVITALVAVIALLRTWALPWVAAVLLMGTPQLAWQLQTDHPERFSKTVGWASAIDPGAWMRMLWAPYHPALLWLGVAVIGLWVVRRFDLSRVRDLGVIAVIGAVLSAGAYLFSSFAWGHWGAPQGSDLKTLAIGDYATLTQDWRWLLGVGAYLPSTPSLVFSAGIVLIAMSLVSLLCLARPVALALKPMAIIGGMTLSAYFFHVLLEGRIALWTAAGQLPNGAEVPTGWANFSAQVAVLFVFLWLWHLLPGRLGKGPLEWLSRLVANSIVR
ncbi:hypothetical protein [Austwickia chelonae]|uniref:hypothetical protein n=1 Tax=Austwickia chelonae TaxID=100225 RepID=UPI000E23D205|nr:hypothetical protein [Austwickia chelonae]